jgi:two-component system NtrC family sensor kinase
VFRNVVDAAVSITGAEEGSLLLLEEDGSQLFMRAAKNFQDSFVQMFRLPVEDTIAGDVIRLGKPVILNQATPRKIITQYLVRSLMYVPLRLGGKVIGVLGVDNRHSQVAFNHEQLSLVSTLADYAAIAIENARLYQKTELERHRLDLILGQIEDAVIVTGPDYRLLLANRKARRLFNLESEPHFGQLLEEVFQNEAVIDLFKGAHEEMPYHAEIALEEGYVLAAHLVQIPNLGFAVTMQDISYFKELDRVKTEFVNTVSHDLRSPLTAILGYVQLIGRVGEVNQQQQEFIDRIQVNVYSISELINSLLELGRIESGLDTYKETVQLTTIVQFAVDELRYMADDRHQVVVFEPAAEIPAVYGDPVRLRQVAENLLVNAILYTPDKGRITIHLASQGDQVILQVMDNGLGIPQPDQPYIFDKFYRASNIPENITGSGLGLAIVKSIVENHQGRVWVDSRPGVGSCFTVVLPIQG